MSRNKPPPLLFIVGDVKNPSKSTKAIKSAKTSHISSRYRYWSKTNHRDLVLDSTTKAILNGPSSYLHKLSTGNYRKTPLELQKPDRGDSDELLPAKDERGMLVRKTADPVSTSENPRVAERQWERALKEYEAWVASPLSILGSQFFDIFTPSTAMKYDVEVKSNLYFYFKTIRPFATHLLRSWQWFDNLAQIQASPCLTYAVATYASVFLSGMLKGGRGVVLPPPSEQGLNSQWTIPPWLRLHTKCLSELNAILSDPNQVIDHSCYQAILFLYRLSVLLADGETGRMHLQALKRMSLLLDVDESSVDRELAVKSSRLIESSGDPIENGIRIEHTSQAVRWPGVLKVPAQACFPESAAAISRMDPDSSGMLEEPEHLEIQRCYQIALFFWLHLNCISFNTSALIVRSNLLELQYRLSNMDLPTMRSICYTTLFNILLAGTMAARSKLERIWFVQQIIWLYPDIQHLNTVWQLLAEFFDPLAVNFRFIEEVWRDIVAARPATTKSASNQDKQFVKPIKHFRPTSYAPDLSKPLPVFELQDMEETALEKSLHKAPGFVKATP